jgi:hypothetical protein
MFGDDGFWFVPVQIAGTAAWIASIRFSGSNIIDNATGYHAIKPPVLHRISENQSRWWLTSRREIEAGLITSHIERRVGWK